MHNVAGQGRIFDQPQGLKVRARAVTRRQAAALSAAAGLGVTMAAAILADRTDIAVLAVGLVCVLVLVSVVHVRRRMVRENSNLARRVELVQRRVVAALEAERLEAADRFGILVASLDAKEASNQAAYRRILASIEAERLAAAERQRQLITHLGSADDALQSVTDRGVTAWEPRSDTEVSLAPVLEIGDRTPDTRR
jgi:hypothetical protein